jgi:hypothetical protein
MTAKDQKKLWEAVKTAVDELNPLLIKASTAIHTYKKVSLNQTDSDDDEDRQAFDQVVELGQLVNTLTQICGPNLLLLNLIAGALNDAEAGHDESVKEQVEEPPNAVH